MCGYNAVSVGLRAGAEHQLAAVQQVLSEYRDALAVPKGVDQARGQGPAREFDQGFRRDTDDARFALGGAVDGDHPQAQFVTYHSKRFIVELLLL